MDENTMNNPIPDATPTTPGSGDQQPMTSPSVPTMPPPMPETPMPETQQPGEGGMMPPAAPQQ